jgi:hypothetical protein
MSQPLDSPQGMTMLAQFAKAHRAVLSPYHEALAEKHGVSLAGIAISRPIPALAKPSIPSV